MAYKRKTRDVWALWWNGERIDEFDTYKEANKMRAEYSLAYGGGVTIKMERRPLPESEG
jgi:hypothetical protein